MRYSQNVCWISCHLKVWHGGSISKMVHSASLVLVVDGACIPHRVGHSTELLVPLGQVMPERDKVEATGIMTQPWKLHSHFYHFLIDESDSVWKGLHWVRGSEDH